MASENTVDFPNDSKEITLPEKLLEMAVTLKTGLPPSAQRSFWKAFGRVFMAAAELPASYLEGKSRIAASRAGIQVAQNEAEAADIRSEQKARDVINRETAKIALKEFENPEFAHRAANYHAQQILREQSRREQILSVAVKELSEAPLQQDSKDEIEDDVLEAILTEGVKRSSDDFKVLFGKILAGEIKQPGSFSIGTIQSLGRLTKETAEIFQSLCNVSTSGFIKAMVVSDPFGHPGDNTLTQFGLSFSQLARLVEEGLIRSEFSERQDLNDLEWQRPLLIENANVKLLIFKSLENDAMQPPSSLRLTGVSFTRAGEELRGVVAMTPSDMYLGDFSKWLRTKNLMLHRAEELDNNRWRLGLIIEPSA